MENKTLPGYVFNMHVDAEEDMEREQSDDGNNLLALAPGLVSAYNRNTYTDTQLRKAGVEVITAPSRELGSGARRQSLHGLPDGACRLMNVQKLACCVQCRLVSAGALLTLLYACQAAPFKL